MSDEKQPDFQVLKETVTRQDGAEVSDLVIEENGNVRQTGSVLIGPGVPKLGAPNQSPLPHPYVPDVYDTDGHSAERHKARKSPPSPTE